jgi:hypothetical protein
LLVGMCGLDLYVRCSCKVGNVAKGICGSWVGILGEGCGGGTKASLRMKIAMVDANGVCD